MPKKAGKTEEFISDDSTVDTLDEMNFDPNCLSPGADGAASSSRKRTLQWNSKYDKYLEEAVELVRGEGEINWEGVSVLVHNKVLANAPPLPTAEQCQRRYRMLRHPSSSFPPWSAEEKADLYKTVLAAQTGQDDTFRKVKGKNKQGEPLIVVDWTKLAEHYGRSVTDLELAYENAKLQNYKRGSFTKEEDQLIIQRVLEWEKTPPELRAKSGGLWVGLQRELNREDRRIAERYRMRLCKRDPNLPAMPSSRPGIAQKMALASSEDAAAVAGDFSDSSADEREAPSKPKRPRTSQAAAPSGASSAPSEAPGLVLSVPTSSSAEPSVIPAAAEAPKPSVWIRWSPEMDAKLQEGKAQGKSWQEIADLVNGVDEQSDGPDDDEDPKKKRRTIQVSAKKCQDRFYRLPRLVGKYSTQEKLEEVSSGV